MSVLQVGSFCSCEETCNNRLMFGAAVAAGALCMHKAGMR